MNPSYPPNQVAVLIAVATIVGLASVMDTPVAATAEDTAEALVQKVVVQTTRSGFGIRSTRELQAGTVSGKHQGWMAVETTVTPAGGFTWRVLDERGSERTRNKVFRELLKAE